MGGAMHDYSGHPTRIATEETRKKGSLLRKLGTEGERRLSVIELFMFHGGGTQSQNCYLPK